MKGSCFLGEPEGIKRHLKIILTEPNASGFVVVVSVTTLDTSKPQDLSCILRKGDHPFIRHDSVIAFDKAQALFAVDIIAKLHSGAYIRKEEMSGAVFERVLSAARASRGMLPRIKSMLFAAL